MQDKKKWGLWAIGKGKLCLAAKLLKELRACSRYFNRATIITRYL